MRVATFILVLILLTAATAAQALNEEEQKQFSLYMGMSLPDLAEASDRKLQGKYPEEDWAAWNFPDFALVDQVVATSYRIAVKEPKLLGAANISDQKVVIPCYCTCQRFGHANLLYCFWKDGRAGDEFDEHGSQCGVCMRQAFLAFLWSELGATHDEVIAGMKEKFAPLIRMQ